MPRVLLASLLLLCLSGCPSAFDPPANCDDGVCAGRDRCVLPPFVPRATCMASCERPTWSAIPPPCPEGSPCIQYLGGDVCWTGGVVPDGAFAPDPSVCASGALRADFEAEPLVFQCRSGCVRDTDCAAPEICLGGMACAVPCTNPQGAPCAEGSTCVEGYCVNARRFIRMDCNGDGDPECPPGTACILTDVGVTCADEGPDP